MLTEICAEIKNWFVRKGDEHSGKFAVVDGAITPPLSFVSDYIRIEGSRLNDGVHKISDNDLEDEPEFCGKVSEMSPPKAFLDLCAEIGEWQTKYGGVDSSAMSPYSSESYGGYSYAKASGGGANGASSAAITWQSVFLNRLNAWRKI